MNRPIDNVITALNEAFATDPMAMQMLMDNGVPVSAELAAHEYLIVNEVKFEDGSKDYMTALGLLNGCLNAAGIVERVAAKMTYDAAVDKCFLSGFCVWEPSFNKPKV